MVSVQSVYNKLRDLANKDQKGFITPAVFNNFAGLAQINIYNESFNEIAAAHGLIRQGSDPGRDKSMRKQALENLSPFVTQVGIPSDSTSNIFFKPQNLSKIISISVGAERSAIEWNTEDEVYTRREVEIVYDVEKIDRILTSNLSTPTEQFPVALISEDIEVFPTTINNIILTYYRRPGSVNLDGESTDSPPTYGEIFMNGMSMYNPQNSLNFMLPTHCESELVMEMAKLIGVRLRDANLTVFATQEEASE
tara:strand:+ start:1430 stop:2185 length:756 start_codon:yes stop_codon:yes gene_type:complete